MRATTHSWSKGPEKRGDTNVRTHAHALVVKIQRAPARQHKWLAVDIDICEAHHALIGSRKPLQGQGLGTVVGKRFLVRVLLV